MPELERPRDVPRRTGPFTPMTPTILCVDDDAGITEMLHDSLTPRGFRVLRAATVAEALGVLRATKIDLVILDLLLPDVDGYSFFELVESEPHKHSFPVIVASGCTSPDARKLAIQHGAAAFLPKPYQLGQLITLLKWMVPPPEEPVVAQHN